MKKQSNTLLFFGEAFKTFGQNGELLIKLSPDAPEKINIKEPVFVIFDGLSVPFYFKSYEGRGNYKLLAIFDDMETEEAASELLGKKIYYNSTKKQKQTAASSDLSDFIGYLLIDEKLGELGKITDFFDYPNNPCFQFIYNDVEILIPVNENLIKGIKSSEQAIMLNLPDGLLDVYLDTDNNA